MKNIDVKVLEAEQKGLFAHTEGYQTVAKGNASHAEGQETQALDNASHAEGRETIAGGKCSHSQGFRTKALADYSIAMGCNIEVVGKNSVGLQLNKEDDCLVTQPNTFAIMGGKVGIGVVSPEHELEVEGSGLMSKLEVNPNPSPCNTCEETQESPNVFEAHGNVGLIGLPKHNPQIVGSVWNCEGILRVSSGKVVDFVTQPEDVSFGANPSVTLNYSYVIYGHHETLNSHVWQMSSNNGLTWLEVPSSFIEDETVLSSPTGDDLEDTLITRSVELNNSVPSATGRIYRLVVNTYNDVVYSDTVSVTN